MIIEVKPIERNTWHKKKGKEAFAQSKKIEVLYDSTTGKLATGLTEEEAKEYGAKLGLDLSDTYVPEQAHPYWSTKAAMIELPNKTVFFDTRKPLDFIRVKNLKAHKLVANSQKELEEGLWPDATHVIYSEEEQMEIKATAVQLKQKAYAILSKLSTDEKADLVLIIGEENVKGKSANFIDGKIDEIITEWPDEFLRYSAMDAKAISIRATLLEGVNRGILNKQNEALYYMDIRLGLDIDDAIEWFNNPDNQKLKVAILEKLNK